MQFEKIKKNGNFILEITNTIYISYRPHGGLPDAWETPPEGETALVIEANFYILDGDHRQEYEQIVNNSSDDIDNAVQRCLEYFYSRPDQRSVWSD